MHLLVTRPEPDAGRLASRLEAIGHMVTRAPLMRIRPVETAPDLTGVQALAFTSANGVRAFASLSEWRGLPVYAVGEATAKEARARGFTEVHAAGGNVKALAALIAARADPRAGSIFHGAGQQVAGNLARALSGPGFEVRRQVLYEAEAAQELPPAAVYALKGEPRALDGALFFSPRTAHLFEELTSRAGLADRLGTVTAYCLSPAVGHALTPGRWARLAVSPATDQTSFLALISRSQNVSVAGGGKPL